MRDAEAHDVFGGAPLQRLAVELHGARRPHHPGDRAKRGGLAGTIGAQNRRDTALGHRKTHAVQRLGTAVERLEGVHLEQHA
jgi:hypothetical protein